MPSPSRSIQPSVPWLAAVVLAMGLGLVWLVAGEDGVEGPLGPGEVVGGGSEGGPGRGEVPRPEGRLRHAMPRLASPWASEAPRRETALEVEAASSGALVRVLGPHGAPVEGALVFAGWPWKVEFRWPARTAPLAQTDESGDAVFSLADCPRVEGRIELVALHPDWGAARGFFRELGSESRLVMGEPLEALVEVRNQADVTVLGSISVGLAPTKESFLNAQEVGPSGPWIRRHVEQLPGTGRMRVRGLSSGGMPLFVGADGYSSTLALIRPSALPAPQEDAAGNFKSLPVQVVRLGTDTGFEFRVTCGGEPCAGITVRIPGIGSDPYLRWCSAAGITDEGGRVSLAVSQPPMPVGAGEESRLPACVVTGIGFKPVNDKLTMEELRRGWKSIELGERAPAGATLRAELFDSEGRPARVGASAIRLDKYGFRGRTSQAFLGHEDTDEKGIVEFKGLPSGVPIGLRIGPRAGVNSGVISTHTEPMLSPGEARSVAVRVGELVMVRGMVLVDGKPSPGAVYGTTESRLGKRYGQFLLEVGASGTFDVSLPRAVYRLGAQLGDGVTREELVLDLASRPSEGTTPEGGAGLVEVSIEFRARRKAPLRGRLVDGSGSGIAHRSILIDSSRSTSVSTTDATGRFEAEFTSPRFAGLWVASKDGRLWDLGRLSISKEQPNELGEIVFDERPVALTIVDGSGSPVRVGGQALTVSRPKSVAIRGGVRSLPRMPLTTDSTGQVALWMPSGEHLIAAPSEAKRFRVPLGAGEPGAPFLIEVRDSARVPYRWQRPPGAQGDGAVAITRVGEADPVRVRLGALPGLTKTLYLARGRYEIAFEGVNGSRTLETVDLTNHPYLR